MGYGSIILCRTWRYLGVGPGIRYSHHFRFVSPDALISNYISYQLHWIFIFRPDICNNVYLNNSRGIY